ncbi:uncharacterized protein LOC120274864 isoform X2 [Dioscorea cayenensis subsp. rotundata]|uniref:Uncharacterized protein LOC120274864 isoform X2 n=1 Tax=Dioscorea cayennensis subsp. rotundata TaxID=55577 RepID=A0AB40CCM7_DIOCR|nr:uncharacterized protein LOC120274864 isoform X2 [Dioscorea cayenensis subsp. rotundata]
MSSSSPTQQHHRRLFELMEEQQEPFILDVYLMENGLTCKASTRTTHVCWPSFACMKLQSFNIHGIRKNRGWLLNFILNKLLHGKALQQKGGNGGMFSVVEEVDEEVESSVEERSPLHHIKTKQEENITAREPLDKGKVVNEVMIFSLEKKMRSFSASKEKWGQYQRTAREIGTEIEVLIFEDICEEIVLDLLDLFSFSM